MPVFAFAFIALCLINTVAPSIPGFAALYMPIKAALVQTSNWAMLIAIAALGLGTSLESILRVGWRHIVVFIGTTLVILAVVLAGLPFVVPA